MDSKLLLLIGVLCVSAVLVLSGILISRRKITAGRQPLSFEEIHKLANPQVSLQTLKRVLTMVGDCYRINPQLIRPEDRLKQFYDLDSWTLGLSTERMNKWLADQGVTANGHAIVTILDLLLFIEQRSAGSNPSSSVPPPSSGCP